MKKKLQNFWYFNFHSIDKVRIEFKDIGLWYSVDNSMCLIDDTVYSVVQKNGMIKKEGKCSAVEHASGNKLSLDEFKEKYKPDYQGYIEREDGIPYWKEIDTREKVSEADREELIRGFRNLAKAFQ